MIENFELKTSLKNTTLSADVFSETTKSITSAEKKDSRQILTNESLSVPLEKLADGKFLYITGKYNETTGLVNEGDDAPFTVNINAIGAIPCNGICIIGLSSPITSLVIDTAPATEKILIHYFINSDT
ncbi:MAG: hypothetical protein L6Q54_11605 [Leptospiraceae bacterium]|nr:hypothetical protein [Leptospiraceae bacterium]